MDKKYKSILVIKMSALGDIIHALPSLYELRQLYPEAKISWLVEPQFKDILPGIPYIDNKIIFYKNDMKKMSFLHKLSYLRSLRKELHSYKFDLVIDLQGLMKSSLIVLLSGCSNSIGYCEMREGSFLFTKAICGPNAKGHVVQRYLDVVRYLGAKVGKVVFPLPAFTKERVKMQEILFAAGVTGQYAVLFPGSRWITKEWPVGHYAELSKMLLRKNIAVVIAGGNDDREKGHKIKELVASEGIIYLTGQTTLTEMAGLIKDASLCVGGDTGPMHVAAAAGIPTVSLFGPVSPTRTGAYGRCSSFVVTDAPCAPCFKRICPRREFICMPGIEPQEVFIEAEKIILCGEE